MSSKCIHLDNRLWKITLFQNLAHITRVNYKNLIKKLFYMRNTWFFLMEKQHVWKTKKHPKRREGQDRTTHNLLKHGNFHMFLWSDLSISRRNRNLRGVGTAICLGSLGTYSASIGYNLRKATAKMIIFTRVVKISKLLNHGFSIYRKNSHLKN